MKFLLSINYIIWLIVSAIFFAVGEFLSKKFALSPKFLYVILILIIYSFGVLAWLPAILQKNSLSIVGTMWSVLSLLTTILIGILIFKEKLSIAGIAGMVMAIIAIILLSIG
jgi:multidrug transporter EmrE-like cation transporter